MQRTIILIYLKINNKKIQYSNVIKLFLKRIYTHRLKVDCWKFYLYCARMSL